MEAPLAPLSSMVVAKLISSSTKVVAKVKVGGCHQQASFFDNINIIGNIPTLLELFHFTFVGSKEVPDAST